MEAVIIDESMKHEWERYLQVNPDSIAWQSYEWSTVLRIHYRFDFHPIAVVDGSEIRGILPLYHMKDIFGRDMLLSVPYAVAGGIVADSEEAVSLLLEKAIELSEKYGSCPVTLKQYKKRVDRPLRTDGNYYNRELDLTAGEDTLWKGLAERNRNCIESTRDLDYWLDYPSSDLDGFYKILLTHQHSRGIPCVSKNWISGLMGSGMYSMAMLKPRCGAVAATLIKEFKDTVSFPFTCMQGKERDENAAIYRLYWELILRFASEGKRIFHSGRIPKSNQTDTFRLGWGGVLYDYYYQYYPDNGKIETEHAKKSGLKRKLFESCWKSMPLEAARLLGPRVVRQFP